MEHSNHEESPVATTLAPDLIEEAFGVDPVAEASVVPPPRQNREYVEGPIVLGYN
ncbi:hypothetical protein ACPZ19_18030 [Amycolatopsis lurida]|uniref:hypothetical protein n=1 Tax=Amycolatopsis sp. YIM 10 TaxID=2653857 RepID=UPI001290882A|nr:hypothetical protein [Amycolatopsis sp. YIM 10]QFU93287.1 hypothetical protein YIM_40750 [Amycolatopsis sp. YIM 10]